MTSPHQQEFVQTQRRQQVADLFLQGWTQSSIATQLGIAQSTVSEDLQRVRQTWQETSAHAIDDLRAPQLAKIDLIEREAWAAGMRSQKPAQSAVVSGEGVNKLSMRNQFAFGIS